MSGESEGGDNGRGCCTNAGLGLQLDFVMLPSQNPSFELATHDRFYRPPADLRSTGCIGERPSVATRCAAPPREPAAMLADRTTLRARVERLIRHPLRRRSRQGARPSKERAVPCANDPWRGGSGIQVPDRMPSPGRAPTLRGHLMRPSLGSTGGRGAAMTCPTGSVTERQPKSASRGSSSVTPNGGSRWRDLRTRTSARVRGKSCP